MDTERIKKGIEKLKPWYQTVYLPVGDIVIRGNGGGEGGYPEIREMMGEDIQGKKVLDLGSNAGLQSIRFAMDGAIVHSVEPVRLYNQQYRFIRDIFETYVGPYPLNITLHKLHAEEIDEIHENNFDVCIAASILYHIGKLNVPGRNAAGVKAALERVIRLICQKSKMCITRNRKLEDIMIYDNLFHKYGFEVTEQNKKSRYLTKYEKVSD